MLYADHAIITKQPTFGIFYALTPPPQKNKLPNLELLSMYYGDSVLPSVGCLSLNTQALHPRNYFSIKISVPFLARVGFSVLNGLRTILWFPV
jgi:hypothetical protein